MANYMTLKTAIQEVIRQNGNNEITGALLQQSLLAMINSLGAGYQFAGVAVPSTNPGTPDQNVFYIASTAGTYANFGNIVIVENETVVLKYNGTWTKENTGLTTTGRTEQLNKNIISTQQAFERCFIRGDLITPASTLSDKYLSKNKYVTDYQGFEINVYEVSPGQVFIANVFSNESSGSAVASLGFFKNSDFSDASNCVEVVPYVWSAFSRTFYIVVVPENAQYLLLNKQTGSNRGYLYGVNNTPDAINEIATGLDALEADLQRNYNFYSYFDLEPVATYTGKYITDNGSFANLGATDIIEYAITPGSSVRLTNKFHTGVSRMYAFYSGQGGTGVISVGPSVSESDDTYTIIAPAGANYVCFTKGGGKVVECQGSQLVSHQAFYDQAQDYFNREDYVKGFIEFKKTGNSVVIGCLFKDKKIGITVGQGGANNLIDFRNIFTFNVNSPVSSPTDVAYIISAVGDMHAPFRFRNDGGTEAVNFTGGNHAYSSGTVKTAVLNYFKVYADGRLLDTNDVGVCKNIRFEWQNDVKPGNAYAAGDSYALRETHKMSFNGINFEEWVDLEPLVNINMGLWYGLQLTPLENQTSIQYAGAVNRLKYGVSEPSDSGDKTCQKVIAENAVAIMSMSIDNSFDLGARSLSNATTRGAFYSGSATGKSYFTIVSSSTYAVNMAQGAHYWLHGYWDVLPQ